MRITLSIHHRGLVTVFGEQRGRTRHERPRCQRGEPKGLPSGCELVDLAKSGQRLLASRPALALPSTVGRSSMETQG